MTRVHREVLTLVLAGGRGSRLEPLTRDRAKPAVPFGGQYRIIDFPLSNCINSDLRRILIITQYKAASLDRHINTGWRFLWRELGEFIDIVPPQQRVNEHWYQGTADAVYQNIYSIEKEDPKHVLILGGDHIYKMNYATMIDFHLQQDADLTIACLPVPIAGANRFGILETSSAGRVIGFEEKPARPRPMPGQEGLALASMGIYVFRASAMYELLCQDAVLPDSRHDFGRDIIPSMIGSTKVMAFPFVDENKKEAAYWRDVGTIEDYYAANMDLIQVDPVLNLYDSTWPITTAMHQFPPPKFVFGERGEGSHVRRGEAHDSIVCGGTIVSGGHVTRSILSPGVRINSYASVEDSLVFERVEVGRHARIRRAIIDKSVEIPSGIEIGYDHDADRARGFFVSDEGIVVIAKAQGIFANERPHTNGVALSPNPTPRAE